jgi:hypothetical protein
MLQPPLPGEGKIILSLAGGCRFLPKPGLVERQARAKTVLTRCNSFVTNFQTQFRRNLAVYYVISLCIAQ